MATAKNRKPAIEKAQGIDDIIRPIAKALKKVVKQKAVPTKNTAKQLKNASKSSPASKKRALEYGVAREAEQQVKKMEKLVGKTFTQHMGERKAVSSFVNMKPRKVKSGRR
jgi:hypothetical protein